MSNVSGYGRRRAQPFRFGRRRCSRFAILRRMVKKVKTNTVKVGLVQMSCELKPEANMKKAIARIGEAAKKGAQIVCLQELFRSQYFCQTEDIELFKLP